MRAAFLRALVVCAGAWLTVGCGAAPLNLDGYAEESGAITIQHKGETIDPYFTLQALLLAHEHGMDTSREATRFANWLLPRQKPDGTFDRFCRQGPNWAPCKVADADDSLLAMWMKFLDAHPTIKRAPGFQKSHDAARVSLQRLADKGRGIYMVSPVYLHGLFMDNLEVWSYAPTHADVQSPKFPDFGKAVFSTFWDEGSKRFHVSTQLEQRQGEGRTFYPDAVAQIFPLLVKFPHVPGGTAAHYRQWMQRHRAEWLTQVKNDFAWGLVAVVAIDQGDTASARCWLRAALPARHSSHWTVSDEVVAQILKARALAPAAPKDACQ